MENYTEESYNSLIDNLFKRFPSFQKVGGEAYKPGLGNVEFFDQIAGRPHRKYMTVHVAGTNGKGSVSNILASALAAAGLKVGLYTSPHISDFRERMRVVDGRSGTGFRLVGKKFVWDFVNSWNSTFDHIGMSFFEITTMMAFDWFSKENVDIAVIETGLGGRLDSTNIITPELSVITNIGLDHCDILGDTLPEIAFEKAGIIKPKVPVVVGESNPETDSVFENKVLYTNLPEIEFMGDRKKVMSLLTFADKIEPVLWEDHEDILAGMDEKGSYQAKNLRTVLAALGVLAESAGQLSRSMRNLLDNKDVLISSIEHTALRTGFRGRWETLRSNPLIIADIGHNAHGLKYNFSQLEQMRSEGRCTHIIMVYGMVADKDVDAVVALMPKDVIWCFTNSSGRRAMPATELEAKYLSHCAENGIESPVTCNFPTVAVALDHACGVAAGLVDENPAALPLIYVGGSTFVVSEAVEALC